MGFVATDIGNVPTGGYEWYVIMVEDPWTDDLRETLSDNFETLSREVGPDALVIKGLDPEEFYPPGFDGNVVGGDAGNLPALLITDEPPNRIDWTGVDPSSPTGPRVIFLPLSEYDRPARTLGSFLQRLVDSLQDPDAIEALERGDGGWIERKWGWLDRYVNLEPSFLGFGVNLNTVISDVVCN